MKKQSCIICGKPLNNGIMIYGRGICKCCEERLVNLDDTTDFYNYYM
ncbi:MAG: sigma factor G inhibitor Gin, partial [Clostridiaceae bacterium]|nr:sigma factor G inhibitor Gin [Clostridiaceae bacterium]